MFLHIHPHLLINSAPLSRSVVPGDVTKCFQNWQMRDDYQQTLCPFSSPSLLLESQKCHDELIKKTSEQYRKLLFGFLSSRLPLRVFYSVKSGGFFCAASPSVFKPFAPHIIVLLLTHSGLKVNLPAPIPKKRENEIAADAPDGKTKTKERGGFSLPGRASCRTTAYRRRPRGDGVSNVISSWLQIKHEPIMKPGTKCPIVLGNVPADVVPSLRRPSLSAPPFIFIACPFERQSVKGVVSVCLCVLGKVHGG